MNDNVGLLLIMHPADIVKVPEVVFREVSDEYVFASAIFLEFLDEMIAQEAFSSGNGNLLRFQVDHIFAAIFLSAMFIPGQSFIADDFPAFAGRRKTGGFQVGIHHDFHEILEGNLRRIAPIPFGVEVAEVALFFLVIPVMRALVVDMLTL